MSGWIQAAMQQNTIIQLDIFLVFVQNISKNANYEEFLIKFVNTNNYTYNFLHGVIILQDAKNCSQHAKIFEG